MALVWNYKQVCLESSFLFLLFSFFKVEKIKNFQNNFTFHHSRKKWHLRKNEIQKKEKIENPRPSKDKEDMIIKFRKIYTSMCFDKVIVTVSKTGTKNELRKLSRSEKRSTILQEKEALTNRSFQLTSRPFVIRCIRDLVLFSRNAANLES